MANVVPKFVNCARADASLGRTDAVLEPVATIEHVVAHFEHLREVVGIEHVGIGADYDGVDETPVGLEDVASYPRLLAALGSGAGPGPTRGPRARQRAAGPRGDAGLTGRQQRSLPFVRKGRERRGSGHTPQARRSGKGFCAVRGASGVSPRTAEPLMVSPARFFFTVWESPASCLRYLPLVRWSMKLVALST